MVRTRVSTLRRRGAQFCDLGKCRLGLVKRFFQCPPLSVGVRRCASLRARIAHGRLAIDRCAKSAARLHHPHWIKCAHAVDEICLGHDPQIVEAGRAVRWHPVVKTKANLSRNVSDRSGDGSRKEVVQYRYRSKTRHDQERSPAHVLDLTPPDLTASRFAHQGSSEIASRRDATAA